MPGSVVSASAEVQETAVRSPAPWWSLWWVRVLGIFFASRVVTTVILLIFAAHQGQNPWTGAHPDYFSYATMWDGLWYNIIAVNGYPSSLPSVDGIHVAENAWAFLPGYPWLVDVVMWVTQLPWAPAAVLVSLVCAAGAALVFYRLMVRVGLGQSSSMFAVVLFCVAPASPLFQLAYAESLALLLLAVALLLLIERRYSWLFPVVLVMAFTRPTGLAFALAVGLHLVYRWVRRHTELFSLREQVLCASLVVFSVIAGFMWPTIAAVVTGSWSAYTDTELAWRSPYIGYTHLVPFASWFQGADWWASVMLGVPGWIGWIGVILLVVVFAALLFSPGVRRLGVDLRFWLAAYSLYLLAVFFPQSSIFRLLMPLFPLLGAVALPTSRVYRGAMVALFLVLQVGWIAICWGVDGADWSPP